MTCSDSFQYCSLNCLRNQTMYVHVTLLIQFLDLQDHCGLQAASEVKSDLGFEISDLNHPHIHVHVTLLIPVFISPRPKGKGIGKGKVRELVREKVRERVRELPL